MDTSKSKKWKCMPGTTIITFISIATIMASVLVYAFFETSIPLITLVPLTLTLAPLFICGLPAFVMSTNTGLAVRARKDFRQIEDEGSLVPSPLKVELPDRELGEDAGQYEVYGRRWYMLLVYFLISAQNNSQWICMSAVAEPAAKFYKTDDFVVISAILVFDIVSPAAFLVSIFISRFGVHWAVFLAAFGTCAGGWVKAVYLKTEGQLIGQTIMALAHIFSAVGMPVFSAMWFPTSERALSTSILFFATVLGGGVGFVLAPLIIGEDPEKVPLFFFVQAIIGTACCLPAIFFQHKPPSPPSRSAEVAESLPSTSFCRDIVKMIQNVQFLILMFAFCLGFAILNTVAITAQDIFKEYTPVQVGIIGAGTVFTGMFGCVFLSIFVDKTELYKEALVMSNVLAGLGMLWLYFTLRYQWSFFWVAACVFFCGFFGISGFPVAYEVGCEINFPIHEAVVTGVMTTLGQWVSIALTSLEYKVVPADKKWLVPLSAAALYVFVVFCLVIFSADLRKRKLDKMRQTDASQLVAGVLPTGYCAAPNTLRSSSILAH